MTIIFNVYDIAAMALMTPACTIINVAIAIARSLSLSRNKATQSSHQMNTYIYINMAINV